MVHLLGGGERERRNVFIGREAKCQGLCSRKVGLTGRPKSPALSGGVGCDLHAPLEATGADSVFKAMGRWDVWGKELVFIFKGNGILAYAPG